MMQTEKKPGFHNIPTIAMSNLRIKISLFLNYFVFAILLNSVGTVILQVQNNFDVSKNAASRLEAYKDFCARTILRKCFLE